ncbi:nicotinamide adenine dinucleotide transporter [Acrasis kona]|uniref:Nicotinamide adenine dinucleotide transporter n=1 Tax=Acrasis kona TaxID=1008807 RepID=A0AAW2YLX3_9EUKA
MPLSDPTINTLSGASSGLIVSVVMSPLDVVKTRIQVHRLPKGVPGKPIYRTFYNLYQQEGIRAFYKGLTTTLLAYIPNWAIYFTAYQYAKTKCSQTFPNQNDNVINILSSVSAGAVCNILTAPLWTVRTRMQTQHGYDDYKNTFDAFKKISSNEGTKALFRGVVPSMFGLVHVGIQFPLYEYIKKQETVLTQSKELSASQVFVASASSKVIASVIAYPHEVVRSRLQDAGHAQKTQDGVVAKATFQPYKGFSDAVRTIWRQEGVRGFYQGMGTNLIRTVPSAVVTLSSYEFVKKLLSKID